MEWTSEQRNEVIAQPMDLATDVDQSRNVIILTMTTEGTLKVYQRRRDDASLIENIGIYRLMLKDTEDQMMAPWRGNDGPRRKEGGD